MSTPGQDARDFNSKEEGRYNEKKYTLQSDFKPKLGPLRTVLCFPEASL